MYCERCLYTPAGKYEQLGLKYLKEALECMLLLQQCGLNWLTVVIVIF